MYCGFKLGDVFITRFFSVCMLALGNLLAFVQSACFSANYSRLGWVPDRSHYSTSVWVPDRSHYSTLGWVPDRSHYSTSGWVPDRSRYSRLGWVPDRSHYSTSVWVPDRSPREEHLGSAGADAFDNLLSLFCYFITHHIL